MNRVRVIGYTVQPQIVIDDGENLTPYPIQPLSVPAKEWDGWVAEGLPAALAEIQAQVDAADISRGLEPAPRGEG